LLPQYYNRLTLFCQYSLIKYLYPLLFDIAYIK